MVGPWEEVAKLVKFRAAMQPATKENFGKYIDRNYSNAVIQLLDGSFFPARMEMARSADEVRGLLLRLQDEDLQEQGFFSFKLFVGHNPECAARIYEDFGERYVPRPPAKKYKAEKESPPEVPLPDLESPEEDGTEVET